MSGPVKAMVALLVMALGLIGLVAILIALQLGASVVGASSSGVAAVLLTTMWLGVEKGAVR